MGALRRSLKKIAVAVAALVLAVGWANDYRSCERQQPIRAFLASDAVINRSASAYWRSTGKPAVADRIDARVKLEQAVRPVGCFTLFPGG